MEPRPIGSEPALQGTIDGAASASSGVHSSNTPHTGVKVSVVGTSLSATVDSEGQFILAGLPSDRVMLRFEAAGTDAKLEISGLVDGLVLTVTLAVQGNQARVLSAPPAKPSCDFRFDGVIEAMSGSRLQVSGRQVEAGEARKIWKGDYPAGLNELRVGDKVNVTKIRTDGNTRFKWSDGTALEPSAIRIGDKAYVEGQKLADGTMQAGKVMVDCR